MVPNNILQRTFNISHNGSSGTAFTIDVDGRQYLVTARHVVDGLTPGSSVTVLRNKAWQPLEISGVWYSPTGADIALLSLKRQLSPALRITLGDSVRFFLSQNIYFLGFPYGLHMDGALINDDYPVAFVKSGIVASFSQVSGGSQIIYCDGHNNPGFSGGPIVTISEKQEIAVIAVVSAYRYSADPILLNGADTGLTYRSNTGLVIGYNIHEAYLRAKALGNGALIT